MARFGITVFVLIAVAVCIFSAGCIGSDTPAAPAPAPTATATETSQQASVTPTGESTPFPDATPVTTVTGEKYGVAVAANDMIRYIVPSNPTTGCDWYADNVTGLVVNQIYVPTPETEGLSGAGGSTVFTITAEKAGTYYFTADYQRPWENKIPEASLNQTLVFSEPVETPSDTPLLTVSFDGKVSPAAGEVVRIITAGNPTTGYVWTVIPNDDLNILNETYIPTPVADGIVGSGGTYEWLVTAEEPGTCQFRAQYKHPWEDEPVDEFFFSITFR